jgi:malonate transporter and related proteins
VFARRSSRFSRSNAAIRSASEVVVPGRLPPSIVTGFATIGVVIAVGYLLARTGVLGPDSRDLLSRMVFFVATPCLLFTTLQQADPHALFSASLLVAVVSVAVAATVYLLVARLCWHRPAADLTVGALAASYVNAGNLGIPLAAYIVGTATPIAPVMLLQLVVMAPLAFAILDVSARHHRPSLAALVAIPLRNPVTVASVLGLLVSVSGIRVPQVVQEPVSLIAGMAVPAALLANGVSLRGAPRVGAGGSHMELAVVVTAKMAVMPLSAWLVGHWVFGLTEAGPSENTTRRCRGPRRPDPDRQR